MFKFVPVEIANNNDFPIESHPFTIGVPCPEGAIFDQEYLKLNFKGQSIQSNVTRLANWSDGSVKWLLLDFQASVEANTRSLFHLVNGIGAEHCIDDQSESVEVEIKEDEEEYLVDTGAARFNISKHRFGPFDRVVHNGNQLLSDDPSHVRLVDGQGNIATSIITGSSLTGLGNKLRKQISITGFFQNSYDENLADFNLQLTFYAGLTIVKCDFTLLNPQAAKHPGGVWDLGDKGSFFFKELSINIQLAKSEDEFASLIRISPGTDWRVAENGNLSLDQNSSGGENWRSKNHVNFKGDVPLEFKGFRYFEQGVQLESGDRAEPCVHMTSVCGGVTARIDNFWQNFPKKIEVEQSALSLNLFPHRVIDCYELQGGERKKHTFYLDFSNNKASLDGYTNNVSPRVPLDYYSETKVIPWLPGCYEDTVIQQLINRGIQGENNFFDKREAIDEYGWRNFGEVFADHEGLEYKGDDELISHYNNQYDPLYGFIKQYIITGDFRWHKLLSELAQHIVDIDIYHTYNDRDEYNGGLFWHTHHYLSAFTCTHRTFSSKHADDFLYGQIGGGPGAQHCYTTGLSYYYFMTGDEVYKSAVLQLVNWVSRVLEGSGTVIERLFQFKSKDLPILKKLLSGETVQKYKYPFTRATGNYITSLIDAYNLTGEQHYLFRIERVIYQSIHPLDDISLRNLHDIESNWSYLIFIQAICKYLDLKISLNEFDEACHYAKDCLLHYVDWMLDNEAPFLQNREKLEYPNHTWTAQDLRKANIFYMASLYSDDKKAKYIEAANFYVRFVEDALKEEETRYFSRILIILMQNYIQNSSLDYDAARFLRSSFHSKSYSPAPLYSFSGILADVLRDIGSRLFKISIKNEKRWLSFRLK